MTRITSNPGGEDTPGEYSPDGTRLVFVRFEDETPVGYFVTNVDGTGDRQLTPDGMVLDDSHFGGSWSPSGDDILFVARETEDHHKAIWIVNADEGSPHQLPITPACGGPLGAAEEYGCYSPDWSPDGDRIVFTRSEPDGSNETLWIVNADGSNPVQVTDGTDDNPNWGPPSTTVISGADEAATESACLAATEGSGPTSTPASSDPAALRMGDLPPGQYTTNSFEPNLVLTLPDGWHQFFPDDADEIALGGPGAELNITRPAQVIDPQSGAPVEAPDSLLEWFTDHSRLDAAEPVEVQVDCIDSHYVDLTAPTADVELFHYPSGDMFCPPE